MALIKGLDERAAAALIEEEKLAAVGLVLMGQFFQHVKELLVDHKLILTLEKKET